MTDESMTDLGSTAYWTAAARARESRQDKPLFDDPWADSLAGPQGRAWADSRSMESLAPMVLRTRFYDDFLRRITTDEGITQIVVLAAGFDTRAFRLTWPEHTVVFELDRADVMLRKEDVLRDAGARPTSTRRVCLADVTAAGWQHQLIDAGFDPSAPSGWLLEGFLFYLPCPAIATLLDEVTGLAAAGSHLGFDIINGEMLTHALTKAWVQMQSEAGAPWIGTVDDPVGFLAARGWRAALSQCGAPDADFGRWPYPQIPLTAPDLPHHWLVTAQKDRPLPGLGDLM